MSLKDLNERLGNEYHVDEVDYYNNIAVKLTINKKRAWSYNESIGSALSGLFKQVYGDTIQDLILDNTKLFDKPAKK